MRGQVTNTKNRHLFSPHARMPRISSGFANCSRPDQRLQRNHPFRK